MMKARSLVATSAECLSRRLLALLSGIVCCVSMLACVGGATHAQAPKLLTGPDTSLRLQAYAGGDELEPGSVAALLQRARVICIGEQHDNALHHQAQAAVINAAARLGKKQPRALGMEMFQRPFQRPLNDYANGHITEQQLLKRSEYRKRWGFPFELYRPVITAAQASNMDLLALNSPRELTKAVARGQLRAGATARQTPHGPLPVLDLSQSTHRRFFEQAMGQALPPPMAVAPDKPPTGHVAAVAGHASMSIGNMYAAQVLWDTTMAEGVAQWLRQHPQGQVLVAAGLGHCHEAGIPLRLRLAGVQNILSVRPIEVARLAEAGNSAMPYYLWLTITNQEPAARSPQLRRRH